MPQDTTKHKCYHVFPRWGTKDKELIDTKDDTATFGGPSDFEIFGRKLHVLKGDTVIMHMDYEKKIFRKPV